MHESVSLKNKRLNVLVRIVGFGRWNVGEQLVEGVLEGDQLLADGFELRDSVKTLVHAVTVVPDLGLCIILLQTLFLYQIIHAADHLDVVRRVIADVFLVALGLDDGKLTFPIAQRGFGDAQYLRNVSDFVEFFIQFLHGLAQIDRIEYLCSL